MMPVHCDQQPAGVLPRQRFKMIAAILAKGVERWRHSIRSANSINLSKSLPDGLEVVSEIGLSVSVGFDPDSDTNSER